MKKYFYLIFFLSIPCKLFCAGGAKLSPVLANLTTMANQTETAADEIEIALGTVLDQAYLDNNSNTIATSGNYILSENVAAPIQINANNVWLNLNGYCITANPGNNGIIVDSTLSAEGKSNITIYNGYIDGPGTTNIGILVNKKCKLIKIESINIRFFSTGVHLLGLLDEETKSCILENIQIKDFINVGIKCEDSHDASFLDCQVISSGDDDEFPRGITFDNAKRCLVQDCSIKNLIGKEAYGIEATSSSSLTILDSIIFSVEANSTTNPVARGILLDATTNSLLKNNKIQKVKNLASGDMGQPTCGIELKNLSNSNIFDNNIVSEVTGPGSTETISGIRLDLSDYNTFCNNTVCDITGTSDYGFEIEAGASGNFFDSNKICNTGGAIMNNGVNNFVRNMSFNNGTTGSGVTFEYTGNAGNYDNIYS